MMDFVTPIPGLSACSTGKYMPITLHRYQLYINDKKCFVCCVFVLVTVTHVENLAKESWKKKRLFYNVQESTLLFCKKKKGKNGNFCVNLVKKSPKEPQKWESGVQ